MLRLLKKPLVVVFWDAKVKLFLMNGLGLKVRDCVGNV